MKKIATIPKNHRLIAIEASRANDLKPYVIWIGWRGKYETLHVALDPSDSCIVFPTVNIFFNYEEVNIYASKNDAIVTAYSYEVSSITQEAIELSPSSYE